jgi:ribonuclease R
MNTWSAVWTESVDMPSNFSKYQTELQARILALFVSPDFQYGFPEIAELCNSRTREEKVELSLAIQHLLRTNTLHEFPNGKMGLPKEEKALTGKVDFVNPRFAYVSLENEDVYVPADALRGAQDGDLVEVLAYPSRKGKKKEGEVLKVLERARNHYVGQLRIKGGMGWFTADYRKMHEEILVPEGQLHGARNGQKVLVEIKHWGTGNRLATGSVMEILGQPGENNAEMHAILADFNIPLRFPAEVEAEANAISAQISDQEIKNRKDFRSINTFTIDPFDAKDFDDALSIQPLKNGNWEVGIHIADVSHFVQPGSMLDKAAFERATSVYLVDRTSPMLPERLSNDLCSLRPKEDRLTFACVAEMDPTGKVIGKPWIGRTIIHSNRRFTYEEVQEILEGKKGEFEEELKVLNEMATQMRNHRLRSGAMAFESAEVKFVLNEQGIPLKVIPKVRKDAHKLIEEFMLLANRCVAEYVYHFKEGKASNPMVYRIHESPNPEKLQTFAEFALRFGYQIKTDENKVASSLNQMVSSLEGKPEQELMQNLAIRIMAKARYTTKAIGHFGLAFQHYSHFTSPIRRYPDVLTHRLLWAYLCEQARNEKEALEKLCFHCSEKEKNAAEAERASIKYKQVEYMALQNPEKVYDAVISGVTEWGIYVDIVENRCEGLVRISDLKGDDFDLNEKEYCLIGRRSGAKLTFGDLVKVRVKATNQEKRTIDFYLEEPGFESAKPKNYQKVSSKLYRDRDKKGRRR